MKRVMVASVCLLLSVGCATTATEEPAAQAPLASGIELANMDPAVRPQDDFFRYVNGTWLATTEIPPDRSSTGVVMDLRDAAREDVRAIIEELAGRSDLEPGSDEQKVADLYNSFMDVARLDELGMAPLAYQQARQQVDDGRNQVGIAIAGDGVL
jgi:endothelin-converting enzyme/putative endopeptidase